MIQLVTFSELIDKLTDDNNLFGAIIFSDKGWREKEGGYSVEERTYIFSGQNKAFGDYCGYSCFASDVAGLDVCIRLEQYWAKWERLACYVMEKDDIAKFKERLSQ